MGFKCIDLQVHLEITLRYSRYAVEQGLIHREMPKANLKNWSKSSLLFIMDTIRLSWCLHTWAQTYPIVGMKESFVYVFQK